LETVSKLESELEAARTALADAKSMLQAARAISPLTESAVATSETAVATTEGATLTARALQVFGQIGARLGLSGTMATAAGGTVVAAGLIVATIIAARLIGGFSADSAISAGRPLRPPATHDIRHNGEKTYNADAYAVFVLANISGGSIAVAQESSLKQAKTCDFAGGGPPGCTTVVRYRKVSRGFTTYEAAQAEWCNQLKGARTEQWAIAGDSKAEVYGGKYWIGTAPAC